MIRRALLAVALGLTAPLSLAQPPEPAAVVRFDQLPPQVQLGLRVVAVQSALPVAPVVVIVPDAASYVERLAGWTREARYPILIDDGTPLAKEDVARFVRAFAPERVLLWSGASKDAEGERRGRVLAAVAAAWGAPPQADTWEALIGHWMAGKHTPFGVVVAHESDPSWTAAAALAAGRGQPVVWVEPPDRGTTGWSKPDRVDRFLEDLAAQLDGLKLPWRDLADAIEGVTLCLNTSPKVQASPASDREMIALTDQVGRLGSTGAPGPRWGWGGQVFGTAAQSAYRAMCALFLHPAPDAGRAWLFDGYRDQGTFAAFDATAAGDALTKAGWSAHVLDAPRSSREDWMRQVERGVNADLVMVNTSGNWDFFDLQPGQCRPTEVPTLGRPAMVHFVHSWSFQVGSRRDAIAGRWLEHGAYAYAGSVQEPFLQAFVPTPDVAQRMLSAAPWGASVRWEAGPFSKPWRIAVFGDPLITWSKRPPAATLDLPGATDLGQTMRHALGEQRFAEALPLLAALGRDGDVAKLAAALLRDRPEALTPTAAAACMMPLFRVGDVETMLKVAVRLGPDPATVVIDNPVALDALWHVAAPRLPTAADHALLYLLRNNIRLEQAGRDVTPLIGAWERVFGRGSGQSMVREVRDKVTRPEIRRELDSLYSGPRR
ncbi:MAG: hypothetical protein FJ255_03445 [Phycisphaerae bacterium]|nr:hypothetical protein [Phycisphaerae bacterium]